MWCRPRCIAPRQSIGRRCTTHRLRDTVRPIMGQGVVTGRLAIGRHTTITEAVEAMAIGDAKRSPTETAAA